MVEPIVSCIRLKHIRRSTLSLKKVNSLWQRMDGAVASGIDVDPPKPIFRYRFNRHLDKKTLITMNLIGRGIEWTLGIGLNCLMLSLKHCLSAKIENSLAIFDWAKTEGNLKL